MNLDSYTPSIDQKKQLSYLLEFLKKCQSSEIKIVVWEGYGLDGLYGKLTRSHEDVDLLATGEQLTLAQKILEDLGYVRDKNIVEKFTYHHPNLDPNFIFEFASTEFLSMLSEKGFEFYIPPRPNASLSGQGFYAMTLAGVKDIIRIQDLRAKEKGWDQYPKYKRTDEYEILTSLLIAELEKSDS